MKGGEIAKRRIRWALGTTAQRQQGGLGARTRGLESGSGWGRNTRDKRQIAKGTARSLQGQNFTPIKYRLILIKFCIFTW